MPEPSPADGSVLARTVALGICGTDREIISGEYGAAGGSVLQTQRATVLQLPAGARPVDGASEGVAAPPVRRVTFAE
jgi:hypothetical protein